MMSNKTFYISIDSAAVSIPIFNDPMLSVFLYSEVDKKIPSTKKHFEQTFEI